jgi:predicted DCC family thiol-disulfide oxidoreductase YuxK
MEPLTHRTSRELNDVVIFDGVCNLCARSVKFILNHEAAPVLRFIPLQSPAGVRHLRELGFDPADAKTFVLIADGKAHVKSDAAIRLASYLRGAWKLIGAIRIIPRAVRDWMYDVVARNRYRWFGRVDACMTPSADLRVRFVEE